MQLRVAYPVRTEEGREIRKAFRSHRKGWKIFSADYSQIELRIMAHLSQDEALCDAFEKGHDVHNRTASNVFGVSVDDVLPEMRRIAKVVNFGIMYGAGPFRMSQELDITRSDAGKIIESYFEQFSGIRRYIDSILEKARKDRFVETILGRRRPVWDLDSENGLRRKAAERKEKGDSLCHPWKCAMHLSHTHGGSLKIRPSSGSSCGYAAVHGNTRPSRDSRSARCPRPCPIQYRTCRHNRRRRTGRPCCVEISIAR